LTSCASAGNALSKKLESEFIVPDDVDPTPAPAPPAAPKKRTLRPRVNLHVGGGNAVEGLGKMSIRNAFLSALPGGGLVAVSSSDDGSFLVGGLLTIDEQVASRLVQAAGMNPDGETTSTPATTTASEAFAFAPIPGAEKPKLPKTFESEAEPVQLIDDDVETDAQEWMKQPIERTNDEPQQMTSPDVE
jgi:hypothetical protein